MESKKWYQSKAIWTAIVTAIIGSATGISTAFGHPITIPDYVYSLLGAVGLYSLRMSDTKIL